ncbi:hypothetical protein F4692_000732 [Nocardioides cavernae]|uniref:Uncharacterized protein n=1 Tax=Nocardioides cavernae TaxID=1921566 RepID=A0A7Y9H0Q2_9ACTN|nr:hypothetical protein [Nocardioides cavernae]NYE35628.1 hypothetical protein [Nocardioides cavernae]
MNTSENNRKRQSSSPFKAAAEPVIETFAKEDRVTHDLYGLGRVVNVEAHAVSVDFGERTLRITSPYAKLHHL